MLLLNEQLFFCFTSDHMVFLGGSVVKNLPVSAGDMGVIPDLGRPHMPWSNEAREPQLLGLCSEARSHRY